MDDYLTSMRTICETYLQSTCLFNFLENMEKHIGSHLSILDLDYKDPSLTEPVEQDRYFGEMKPCGPLIVDNVKVGYLGIEKAAVITEELKPVLKLIGEFVSKMPEVTKKVAMGGDAYQAGIYELMFSTDLQRMASLRAQIGLSRFNNEGKIYNSFVINITSMEGDCLPSGLEMQIRQKCMSEGDVLLEHGKNLVLFHVQQGESLETGYMDMLEELLKRYHAIGCSSERIKDPSHDFRLRQHYNQNEQVLLYLKRSRCTDKRLVRYDDYRLVSMVYFALLESNKLIFGKYRYVSNTVMKLCKCDEEKGTEYFETLYTYLNTRYSLNETAQRLNIHRNTVVYRIQQLREKFGIDLDSPEECFKLNLSCRIYLISKYIED